MGGEYDVSPSRIRGPLFDGSLGRAMRPCLILIVCTWFAYFNPLKLAYVYLLPVLSILSVSLYPPFLATLCMMWTLLTPYSIVRGIYVTLIGSLTSYLMEKRGWEVSDVRWIPFGWYLALALVLCQARTALNNKTVYAIILSAHYIFDNSLLPVFTLSVRGLSFIADGRMMAILRAIAVDINSIPWIPDQYKALLAELDHPQCDHLFGKTAPKELLKPAISAIRSGKSLDDLFDWTLVPNQACKIPVPLFVRLLGGVFENSKGSLMTLSTDASAKFLSMTYLPNQKFFFSTLWYAEGDYGVFRGLYYCSVIAAVMLTIMICMKPNARTRYFLKDRLIAVQRGLCKYSSNVVESAGLISARDRADNRMYLVSFPPVQKYGRNSFTNWFIKRYVPSNDLDHLHERAQDLQPLANLSYLESAISQTPGIQSAPALRGLINVLTHEAVNQSIFTRSLALRDMPCVTHWHHPIGRLIRSPETKLATIKTDDELGFGWLRAVYFAHWRVGVLVERALQVDETCGRDRTSQEILCEIRHSLQLELREVSHLLRHCPNSSIATAFDNSPLSADRFVRTFGYGAIEKCKATILYCEGEIEKRWSTFMVSVLVSVYGPAALIAKEILAGWRNFFSSLLCHRADDMPDPQFRYQELVVGKPGGYSGVALGPPTFVSRERRIPLALNAEVWGSLRFFAGQALIFCVFLFNESLTTRTWLRSARIHQEDSKLLGDELNLDNVDLSFIYAIFKPSTNGEGQDGKIKVLPGLLWASVPMLTVSKLVPWTFLGYYCSNLITYQGTIKRSLLRYTAMLIGTGISWFALWFGFKYFRDDESNPYDDSSFAFREGSFLRAKLLTWLCGLGCLQILLGTILFVNPFERRYTFDPQWGYMGQILTYHFLVVSYGLFFDHRQSRDELILVRVAGHTIGTGISIALALLFFPTSANTQQRIRLANLSVPLRKSFIALNCSFSQKITSVASQEEWQKYLEKQLTVGDFEFQHYRKIVDDASIADTVKVLRNDKVLLEIGCLMQKALFTRSSSYRLMLNLESFTPFVKENDVWEKDLSFHEWVNQTSPLKGSAEDLLNRKGVSRGHRPLRLVEPASPYRWYSYESGDSANSVWPIPRPNNWVSNQVAKEATMNLDTDSLLTSGITLSSDYAESDSEQEGKPNSFESSPCTDLVDHLNVVQELWLCVEYALLNMKSAKFDLEEWKEHVFALVTSLNERIQSHLNNHYRSTDPAERRWHILYSTWADELSIVSRIAAYIEEYVVQRQGKCF